MFKTVFKLHMIILALMFFLLLYSLPTFQEVFKPLLIALTHN